METESIELESKRKVINSMDHQHLARLLHTVTSERECTADERNPEVPVLKL